MRQEFSLAEKKEGKITLGGTPTSFGGKEERGGRE